ncbi:MAG: response regulator transcription factor [Gemmataceae bacterium]|nr:response regulator transcription factor [Gemmataceae bacterium]
MPKLRVLIADDHPMLRSGLRGLIDVQPDMDVVGEASDGAAAIQMASDVRPDVVVMDVSMPGMGGAEATEQMRRRCEGVKVLALTAHEERGYVQKLMRAGASGYVIKRTAADELVRAIRTVAAGKTYIDPAVAGLLVTPSAPSQDLVPTVELSERECEVLQRIARGHPVKQIAASLDITVRTVETYKARGMEKLNLKTRADLVRYALRQGWLSESA